MLPQPTTSKPSAKIERLCRVCGAAFLAVPSQIARGSGKYCRRACSNEGLSTPLADRFWRHVEKGDACWLWNGAHDAQGYGRFAYVSQRPNRVLVTAHRAAWMITNGPIPDGLHVCHQCDNPPCVRPDHLFLGTPKENAEDKVSKGRQTQGPRLHTTGERNVRAKLTEADVRLIRVQYHAGVDLQAITAQYPVTRGTIVDIIANRTWAHLTQ